MQQANVPADRLVQLLAGSRCRPGGERREKMRLPLCVPVVLVPVLGGHLGPPLSVQTVDVSAGGMRLSCPQPLGQGELFFVGIRRSDGRRTWVQCQVRHCQAEGTGRYLIGSQFGRLVPMAGSSGSSPSPHQQVPQPLAQEAPGAEQAEAGEEAEVDRMREAIAHLHDAGQPGSSASAASSPGRT